MSAPAICRRINEFCEFLITNELALNVGSHFVRPLEAGRKRITWTKSAVAYARERNDDVRLSEYLAALRNRDFSILMYDGAILQVSLDYASRRLVGHRYVFLPCPIFFQSGDLHHGDLGPVPLEDYLSDIAVDELQDRIRIRAPLRFEFDPVAETEEHPASHVHVGKSESRVAVSGPVSSERFLRFVFKNFYACEFKEYDTIRNLNSPVIEDTISEEQEKELHIRVGR